MRHSLRPHPDFPPSDVHAVEVAAELTRGSLRYVVAGAGALAVPEPAGGDRADGLWRTTCFELFVRPTGGAAYFEFNLSPSTEWAAYGFDGYRAGMRDLAIPAPRIEWSPAGLSAELDLSKLPPPPWRIGLSAVIEELDGTKSFWAIAHPAGKPDFHHPDCFVLELPAANAA